MISLHCDVQIISNKPLEEIADLISERVLGGIPLGGREDYIFDEVPAVYAKLHVLGMRAVLQGDGTRHPYFFHLHDARPLPKTSPDEIQRSAVNISPLVMELLNGIDGVQAVLAQKE